MPDQDKGNGAHEALVELMAHLTGERSTGNVDWLLAELWSRGFKVAPLERADLKDLN